MSIDQAVIAGWTGRDPVARDKHIAELEAIGIARPATTPIYYRCSARRLTIADVIEVCGGNSSGEVEFVLIGWQGRIFVGLRLRPHRPQGRSLQRHGVETDVRQADGARCCGSSRTSSRHWDKMILRSWAWIDGARVLYQEGTLDAMLPVKELIERGFGGRGCPTAAPCSAAPLPPRAASARPTGSNIELEDPVLKRKISHAYDVIVLPVLG